MASRCYRFASHFLHLDHSVSIAPINVFMDVAYVRLPDKIRPVEIFVRRRKIGGSSLAVAD
jgi:hypothetical protein